jgi:hypothetical protein
MTVRIQVSGNTNPGKMTLQFVARLQEALAMGRRVKAVLDMAQNGNPADWPAVAAELGLVDRAGYTAVAQAQDAYAVLSNAMDHVGHAAVLETSRLDQG